VAPRRHYGHAAIAMALTLWAITQAPVGTIRRRICAWPVTSEDRRWPTLQRWAGAARTMVGDPGLSLRGAAARVAQIAIGYAPPWLRAEPRCYQAFAGGSTMS